MIAPQTPANEEQRLEELRTLNILDTLPEKDYDDISKIASQICGTPVALISFIDKDRQWYKSAHGVEITEIPRGISFCAHAILNPDEPLVINDMREDARFKENPLVTEDPKVHFYAAVPLVSEGLAVGSICVVDLKPNQLDEQQVESLRALGNQLVRLLEFRKTVLRLEESERNAVVAYDNLNEFAHVVSHDLKSPIRGMTMLAEALEEDHGDKLDEEAKNYLRLIKKSATNARELVDGVLRYSQAVHTLKDTKEEVSTKSLISEIIPKLNAPKHFNFELPEELPTLRISKVAMEQIFTNLLSNAVKYNDKLTPKVKIDYDQDGKYFNFKIADNGSGIPEKDLQNIFGLFNKGSKVSLLNRESHGVGLTIVKKLAEHLEGKVSVSSKEGEGTEFVISIPG